MASATLAVELWTTTERGSCLLCTAEDRPMVDTALDLEDGRRVLVCESCGTRLAKVLRVGSKATAAVREELEGELAERDQRLSRLGAELARHEQTIAELREQVDHKGESLHRAAVFASQAVGLLQQIGR